MPVERARKTKNADIAMDRHNGDDHCIVLADFAVVLIREVYGRGEVNPGFTRDEGRLPRLAKTERLPPAGCEPAAQCEVIHKAELG